MLNPPVAAPQDATARQKPWQRNLLRQWLTQSLLQQRPPSQPPTALPSPVATRLAKPPTATWRMVKKCLFEPVLAAASI